MEEDDEELYGANGLPLTPAELKKRRLARKAELARMSRNSKKARLVELEDEVADLRRQLDEARRVRERTMIPPAAGAVAPYSGAAGPSGAPIGAVQLDDLQFVLQDVVNSVVPALVALAAHTRIPALMPRVAPALDVPTPTSHSDAVAAATAAAAAASGSVGAITASANAAAQHMMQHAPAPPPRPMRAPGPAQGPAPGPYMHSHGQM
jgi:hypothetical protein